MEENMQQDVQPIAVEEVYVPPVPAVEETVVVAEEVQESSAMEVTEPAVKVGDRIRIFIDPPGGEIATGTVRVVQNVPGKQVGVELDQFTDRCHSLDGLVQERVDETRGVVVGKGWWTRGENIEALQ